MHTAAVNTSQWCTREALTAGQKKCCIDRQTQFQSFPFCFHAGLNWSNLPAQTTCLSVTGGDAQKVADKPVFYYEINLKLSAAQCNISKCVLSCFHVCYKTRLNCTKYVITSSPLSSRYQ